MGVHCATGSHSLWKSRGLAEHYLENMFEGGEHVWQSEGCRGKQKPGYHLFSCRQAISEPAAWLTGQVRGPGHTMSSPFHAVLWLLKSLQSGCLFEEKLYSVALSGFLPGFLSV